MPQDDINSLLEAILDKERTNQLDRLLEGYRLSSQSEGKSPNTIAIVEASVHYLSQFLEANDLSTNATRIGVGELRRFITHLREQPRFTHHRFTRPQDGHLSGHTINAYLRALQAFWAWLKREDFIDENPFTRLKIPKAPKKVIPIFTDEQLRRLFATIDTATPVGYRNYTIILTLLDTGMRCSELTSLKLTDVNLESRFLKVWGKGNKERLVPIGAKVQKALWKYLARYRPEPAIPRHDHVFLTRDGHPLTKDRLEAIIERYGKKAGIAGVRVSPHTFRHTMAITFLRNGGDVFSLQRILGHSQLEVLRGYVNLAQADIARVHQRNSPADNLEFKIHRASKRRTYETMTSQQTTSQKLKEVPDGNRRKISSD
jgi:integrase/recombinase XerD